MGWNKLLESALIGQLKRKNPQGYQQMQQLLSSGKTPEQCIEYMLQNGMIGQNQVNQATQMAKQYLNQNGNPQQNNNNSRNHF